MARDWIDLEPEQVRAYMREHQEEEYLLVDVRQPKEYARGHIPGAVLMPLGELTARMVELPVDRDLIFY